MLGVWGGDLLWFSEIFCDGFSNLSCSSGEKKYFDILGTDFGPKVLTGDLLRKRLIVVEYILIILSLQKMYRLSYKFNDVPFKLNHIRKSYIYIYMIILFSKK